MAWFLNRSEIKIAMYSLETMIKILNGYFFKGYLAFCSYWCPNCPTGLPNLVIDGQMNRWIDRYLHFIVSNMAMDKQIDRWINLNSQIDEQIGQLQIIVIIEWDFLIMDRQMVEEIDDRCIDKYMGGEGVDMS